MKKRKNLSSTHVTSQCHDMFTLLCFAFLLIRIAFKSHNMDDDIQREREKKERMEQYEKVRRKYEQLWMDLGLDD